MGYYHPLSFWQCGAEPTFGSALAFSTQDMKRRVIVYIDGFNLYYGLVKGTLWKWLDLVALARSLLRDDMELVGVKYFTSRVRQDDGNAQAVLHQDIYLQALASFPLLQITEGYYTRHEVSLPFSKEPCKTCRGHADVFKTEEKRTDVNIAVAMLADAHDNAADVFVLISGDADLAGPVGYLRQRLGKSVSVFDPQKSVCGELKRRATFYRNIPRDLPARCQLPDEVRVSDKVIVRCPVAWKVPYFREKVGKSAEDIEQEIRNQSLEDLRLATLMLEGASVPESPDVALERKGLIADGKLTPQGMAAAKRVLRKYGILNRLASVGK